MTLATKLATLRLTLSIQETMVKLWALRVKTSKLKISQIQRDSKNLRKSAKSAD